MSESSSPSSYSLTEQAKAQLKVAGAISFYVIVALVMVIGNKWVLINSDLPVTFIWLQMIIAVALMHSFSFVKPDLMELPKVNIKTSLALAPYILVGAAGFIFNTYCLKLVDASYFQVARGLTLPFTVLLECITSGYKLPTLATAASCVIVTYGFLHSILPVLLGDLLKSTANNIPSGLGVFFGAMAAALLALHAIMIKAGLKAVDGKAMDLAYYSNLMGAVSLFPVVVFSGEIFKWNQLVGGSFEEIRTFVLGTALTGLFGFLVCIAGILSVKLTSPVSHMFTSAVRSGLQTFMGAWLFSEIIDASRIQSILLIFFGSTFYTWVKSRQQIRSPTLPSSETLESVKQPLLPTSRPSPAIEQKEVVEKQ